MFFSTISRAASRLSTASPRVYELVQGFFGLKQLQARLAPWLAEASGKRVLDVGAGTGLSRALLPDTAQYVWLDIDWRKLRGFRRRYSDGLVCIADGSFLPLRDQSVDMGLCVAVSHHLTDRQLVCLCGELARVVRERIIFLDALLCPDSLVSRLLWNCDGGGYPRSADALLAVMERRLEVERVQKFTVYHRYLLCTAHPKMH